MGNTTSTSYAVPAGKPTEPRVHKDVTGRKTYTYHGKTYISSFPKEWLRHKIGTGPEMCENCQYHGSYNGVFIGYCTTCAREYSGERGNGFDNHFREHDPRGEKSATQTYLKEVRLSEIIMSDFYDEFESYDDDSMTGISLDTLKEPEPEPMDQIPSDLSQSMWQAVPTQESELNGEAGEPQPETTPKVIVHESVVEVKEEVEEKIKRSESNGAIFIQTPVPSVKPKPPKPCKYCKGDHWNRDCPTRQKAVKFNMNSSIDN